ncbi:hypothetical protein [Streptomyces natalensis]|uniref:hypothetical protein n=1 Tax=Streptomyces natalensis TaxID=68242 RepID=UPI000A432242|nr:hypothetical protein [Streptomyces natalensis]
MKLALWHADEDAVWLMLIRDADEGCTSRLLAKGKRALRGGKLPHGHNILGVLRVGTHCGAHDIENTNSEDPPS